MRKVKQNYYKFKKICMKDEECENYLLEQEC